MKRFCGSFNTDLEGGGRFRGIKGWHHRERLYTSLGYMMPARKEQIAVVA